MNETITSQIKAKRRDSQAIKLSDEEWYSVHPNRVGDLAPFQKGDNVVVEYKLNGQYRNITSCKYNSEMSGQTAHKTNGAGETSRPRNNSPKQFVAREFPMPATHPDRTILRSVALKAAVDHFVSSDVPVNKETEIEYARYYEDYLSGDLDAKQAANLIEDDGSEIKNAIPDVD